MSDLKRFLISEIYEYELWATDDENARDLFDQWISAGEDSEVNCEFKDNALEVAEITERGIIDAAARAVLLELADTIPEVMETDTYKAHFQEQTPAQCPNHNGAFDCSPFCELCAGEQQLKGKE